MLYCLVGGQTNLVYFDLGDEGDRRFSMAQALARRGFLVVLADHPGIGRSTMPRDEWALTPDLLIAAHSHAGAAVIEGLRQGSLTPELEALPGLTALGCGHSMGAVMTIGVQGATGLFSGIALLGYGSGGLPQMLPPEAVEKARDAEWLRTYLPELARERFGTARITHEAARGKRRGRENGSPSFHSDSADPEGKLAQRAAAAPLLTMPGLYAMFPGVSDEPSAKIDVPILVVTGAEDFIPAGEALRAQFPACPRLEICQPEDTGHNLFIFPSREESFARIANWAEEMVSPPA